MRGTQSTRTSWTSETYYSATAPGNFITTALENTFGTVGQSMMQLARAQDQTNRHLQQHLQQGQLNMQVHTGALQQLATSTYQCNFDHIFASIPIYDGRSAGPVQNVIMLDLGKLLGRN